MSAESRKEKQFRRRVGRVTVGENRGLPRIWLEGKYLVEAGFKPLAPIEVELTPDKVVVRLDPQGGRHVAAKSEDLPVIEIKKSALTEMFDEREVLEVVTESGRIEISRTRTERRKRERVKNGLEGSGFSGGGLLTEAASQAGLKPEFAVELEEEYADIFAVNHPGAEIHNVPIEQIEPRFFEDRKVEVLTLGVPCQPYSRAWRNTDGQTKRDASLPPESHDLGHLTYSAIKMVDLVNPHSCIIENVPGYLSSGAYYVLKGALKAMGYNVDARVLSPLDFGSLTDRKRAVILATTDEQILWPVPTPRGMSRLGDILEPEEETENLYFDRTTKTWLYRHWDTQTAKGNGFASQVVSRDATHVGVIKKGYLKEQGDNPVLAHPTRPDTHRWFTLTELRRLHSLRDDYYLGESKRTAGEILGQGVDVGFFRQVIAAMTGRTQGITGDHLDRMLSGAGWEEIEKEQDTEQPDMLSDLASGPDEAPPQLVLFGDEPPRKRTPR